ncbi:PREDICTED: uncharacterized protein LOC106805969 [Priapulus caudatus]|uniref:Uncharacterized protein LOC106805969 n=1 Tax=Priapulus caudatus TaxID=37621 RepID=A0ABM1DTJ3_PRICU|nr:PREDICTED: uncharacterized protein LOC106805969 [Priapulus caudatus]
MYDIPYQIRHTSFLRGRMLHYVGITIVAIGVLFSHTAEADIIVQHPQNVTVIEGTPLTLPCSVNASYDGATVAWVRDGTVVLDVGTDPGYEWDLSNNDTDNYDLRITHPDVEVDNTIFACRVSWQGQDFLSENAHVLVAVAPMDAYFVDADGNPITERLVLEPNVNFTATCYVRNGNPASYIPTESNEITQCASVREAKSSFLDIVIDSQPGDRNNTLTMFAQFTWVTTNDPCLVGGSFSCSGYNLVNENNYHTASIYYDFKSTPEVSIKDYVEEIALDETEGVTLQCTGNGVAPLTIQWFKVTYKNRCG